MAGLQRELPKRLRLRNCRVGAGAPFSERCRLANQSQHEANNTDRAPVAMLQAA